MGNHDAVRLGNRDKAEFANTLALALLPGALFAMAWALLASGHFAAWDVMEEVASTTGTARLTRSILAPLGLVGTILALTAGWITGRRLIATGSATDYALLNCIGIAAIVFVVGTTGIADERVYPLTSASVDVVPLHSVLLLIAATVAPGVVLMRSIRD